MHLKSIIASFFLFRKGLAGGPSSPDAPGPSSVSPKKNDEIDTFPVPRARHHKKALKKH